MFTRIMAATVAPRNASKARSLPTGEPTLPVIDLPSPDGGSKPSPVPYYHRKLTRDLPTNRAGSSRFPPINRPSHGTCHAPYNRPSRHPQHRHHRPRRRRQDDDHRAHPLLHGAQAHHHRHPRHEGPQDFDDDGLPRARAEARHHHPVRRGLDLLAQEEDQRHRHPGARRLHHRSEPLAARARRRGRGVRRRGGRGAAVRDQLAPRRQLRRAAHLLRQQDGPQRRLVHALRRHDQEASELAAAAGADPDRLRGQLQGHDRPRRDEGPGVGFGRQGRAVGRARCHGRPRRHARHHRADRSRDPRQGVRVPQGTRRHLPRDG